MIITIACLMIFVITLVNFVKSLKKSPHTHVISCIFLFVGIIIAILGFSLLFMPDSGCEPQLVKQIKLIDNSEGKYIIFDSKNDKYVYFAENEEFRIQEPKSLSKYEIGNLEETDNNQAIINVYEIKSIGKWIGFFAKSKYKYEIEVPEGTIEYKY